MSPAPSPRPSRPASAPADSVVVRGAREHNLKGVDLTFPRDALVTFTGVSGSGKSSLAYHTIYQEGQRRFLESLSSYARQFLGRMEKPKVDHIEGLSPTVSIDQKSTGASPRSTVGTMTEVLDFLRLLWARLGEPVCPECGAAIETWSVDRITQAVLQHYANEPVLVLAPVIRERKGEYRKELSDFRARGFVRARIDGAVRRLDEDIELHRYKYHTIELVLDRLRAEPDKASRLAEAIEQALALADGLVAIVRGEADDYRVFSTKRACPQGHGSIPEMEPRLFSFNSPVGACRACEGLGTVQSFAEDLLVRDASLSLAEGALHVITDEGRLVYGNYTLEHLQQVGEAFEFDIHTPWKKLSPKARKVILHGSGKTRFRFQWKREGAMWTSEGSDEGAFPGVIPHLKRTYSPGKARHLDKFMAMTECSECEGERLGAVGRGVKFAAKRLPEILRAPVGEALAFVRDLQLTGNAAIVGGEILREILDRLHFLDQVGLGYLTLDRRADTLSGGEAQRIRLAAQVGSGLRGVLYVLDEPSIGLHTRDQDRLLATLRALRDRGNTVCVVEHDEDTMRQSDFLVDVGPGAGVHGGEIVAAGTPAQVMANPASLTGRYLRGAASIEATVRERRPGNGQTLLIEGARHHNLQDVTARVPLGCFVAVTGVSGSGKSTLVNHVLKRALRRVLHNALDVPGKHDRITGVQHLDKIIEIDQQPIGRTPRSNPATYTGVWDHIRDLFAALPESKLREYKKGRFSFNVAGGRCEACEGAGVSVLEMQFLAPVEVVCEVCQGQRFNPETLEITFKGKHVADVLDLSIEEACALFVHLPKIETGLQTLVDVGVGYLKLGQTSTTLSGGEAQRIKLATELQRPATGRTLYVLDEPTTGLHFADVARLLTCLHALVDAGNSVVVIEHNLDVIKSADWLIDMGPEGGGGGGKIVAEGTPEQVAKSKTHTGRALAAAFAPRVEVAGATGRVSTGHVAADHIHIRNARTNNLQGVTTSIPLGSFTVVTGPSGSGKSSLAFDTLFSEGQRRFIESMSTYARRFLGRMDRAPVDAIEGLGPTIAIDQRAASRSPRSTVATTTEIQDYLRLLWARVGRPHCPTHGDELVQHSPSSIAKQAAAELADQKGYVLAPVRVPQDARASVDALTHFVTNLQRSWKEKGFARALVNGAEWRLEQPLPTLGAPADCQLALVVDRVAFKDRARIVDAAAQATQESGGVVVLRTTAGEEHVFATDRACPHCGHHVPLNPHPRYFSFNHHSGACSACAGLGQVVKCDVAALVNHPDRALFGGGIQHRGAVFTFLTKKGGWYHTIAKQLAKELEFDLDVAFAELPEEAQQVLLWGADDARFAVTYRSKRPGKARTWSAAVKWKGIAKQIEEWFHGGTENDQPDRLGAVMRTQACPACEGSRLGLAQRHVLVGGMSLPQFTAQTVEDALQKLDALKLRKPEKTIADEVLKELRNRLRFLASVGLEYLGLDRSAASLSGGEAQRIRLATQLGNRLVGVLYVLDEPTIGLHPRDTEKLLGTLQDLRDLGNTVVAVEHDEHVIRRADWVVDMGPGAGRYGGKVVADGPPAQVAKSDSLTGRYLRGELGVALPEARRTPSRVLKLKKLRANNIAGVDLALPLGVLCAVTGVSGSGKSSLVMDAVLPELQKLAEKSLAARDEAELLQVAVVDQSPIGTTPASVPASYVEVLAPIRDLFATTPQAKVKGFRAGRFSFNVADGRCPACEGKGQVRVEMHFLADVWITCETCRGKRYDAETLSVRYRDRTIADVLAMEAHQALEFFGNHPRIRASLQTMVEVGLGYLQLGQSATTLSGGEAQRLKLVSALARMQRGHTIFVLDEPTTGLHVDDVSKLLHALQRLVARGDTVVVIEHHLDVIKSADWVIEMGPEAGAGGGKIVVQGTPEQVAKSKCHTARFLKDALGKRGGADRVAERAAVEE